MKRVAVGCLLPLAVLALAVVGFVVLTTLKKPPEKVADAKPLLMVKVAIARQQQVAYLVHSQGTIEPKTQTALAAEVGGRIIEVSDNFRSGSMVHKGELLARIDPADYQTALSHAEADLAQAVASLEQEKAQGRVAAQEWRSVSPEKVTAIALRKPQLASALAQVKSQQARVEEARRNLERTEIRAPFNGLLRQRSIALGQYVGVGTALGVIDDTSVAEVRLPVSDTELAWLGLSSGSDSGVTIDLADTVAGFAHHWPAKLVQSSGVLDAQSRMSFIIAEVANPYQPTIQGRPWLKFGTFVEASLRSGIKRQLVVLPKDAVRGDQVVLVDEKDQIHHHKVQVARTDPRYAYISHGLKDGDRVAMTSLTNVVDGTKVAIAPSEPETENNGQLTVGAK
ncbi:efflux RND transporter periplasmic adaptor subunit [Gallaecimonas mangrovi]|uniref:efflux RND transporter periplasmic adaptor subunit n=1 Tax=Gallaecimonas mangrovi TaxID=2291597 RepID=UPI001868F077|nr:efflux RND transporter periplasmic adaptor subunit [Gallaecimonas mangrovi]